MSRYLLISWMILLLPNIIYAQFSESTQFLVSSTLVFGTQNNALRFSVNVVSVISVNDFATELSLGAAYDVSLTKYGRYYKGQSLRIESYGLVGRKRGASEPLYAGELNAANGQNLFIDQAINGAGIGMQKNMLYQDLRPLSNRQGMFIVRTSVAHRPLLLRIKNDFRAGLFLGGGTDQGETGAFHISYVFSDGNDYLHTVGLNLLLITPVPDYTLNPTDYVNSDDYSKPVLKIKDPDVFHANIFVQHGVRSNRVSQNTFLGIDSHRAGGKIQNALHDSFGLYPRFPWDKNQKDKIYFESSTSIHYGF